MALGDEPGNGFLTSFIANQIPAFQFTLKPKAILESGKLQKHWRRLSRIYSRRQSAMIRALRSHFPADSSWQSNDGGIWLWVRVPAKVSVASLLERSIKSGVYFSPGETHFVEPDDQPYMRLNFAALDERQIENGINVIGSLIHKNWGNSSKIGSSG